MTEIALLYFRAWPTLFNVSRSCEPLGIKDQGAKSLPATTSVLRPGKEWMNPMCNISSVLFQSRNRVSGPLNTGSKRSNNQAY